VYDQNEKGHWLRWTLLTSSWSLERDELLDVHPKSVHAVVRGVIYIAGGCKEQLWDRRTIMNSVVKSYNPISMKWHRLRSVPSINGIMHGTTIGSVWANNEWYLFGRPEFDDDNCTIPVMRYDITNDKWTVLRPLPLSISIYSCITIDTVPSIMGILLFGLDSVLLYNPVIHALTPLAWPLLTSPIGWYSFLSSFPSLACSLISYNRASIIPVMTVRRVEWISTIVH
jgi:hypothetical protein